MFTFNHPSTPDGVKKKKKSIRVKINTTQLTFLPSIIVFSNCDMYLLNNVSPFLFNKSLRILQILIWVLSISMYLGLQPVNNIHFGLAE